MEANIPLRTVARQQLYYNFAAILFVQTGKLVDQLRGEKYSLSEKKYEVPRREKSG